MKASKTITSEEFDILSRMLLEIQKEVRELKDGVHTRYSISS